MSKSNLIVLYIGEGSFIMKSGLKGILTHENLVK